MCDAFGSCSYGPYPARGVTSPGLAWGARPTGCVQTTPGAMRQIEAYTERSYYNFFRSQTKPFQELFSGPGQSCNGCPVNKFSVWIPSVPPSSALPCAGSRRPMCNQPIAPATAPLAPLCGPGRSSFASPHSEFVYRRVPFLGLPASACF